MNNTVRTYPRSLATPEARRTEPTRSLFDPSDARLKYTKSENTNVARTFRKARLLARIQGASV